MSTINTNGINTNYPIPGKNNPVSGFKDNFTSIKNNLNTAADEITDLQNKSVLKAALNDTTLNNDMANTLISNAAIRSFRHTTYNLGSALSGIVKVNAAMGDFQYGTVAANVTLQFGSWSPTNTESELILRLGFANSAATVLFPSQVVASNNNFGGTILENYDHINGVVAITPPNGVTQIDFKLRTIDCGNTISIEPLNRPFKSSQIQKRTPPSTGQPGDMVGTICVDRDFAIQIEITETFANNQILTDDAGWLWPGQAIKFTGNTFGGITVGTTYYVNSVASSFTFDVATSGDGNVSNVVSLSNASGTMYANPITYMYVAVDDYVANSYNRNIQSTTAPNIITVSGTTANLTVNNPIVFTGTGSGNTANLQTDKVYYIKSVSGSNVTISNTRYNGIAGPEFANITTVGAGNVDIDYTVYDGPDIFRRIPLEPF